MDGWIDAHSARMNILILMKNLPLLGPLPGLTQVWERYSKGKPKMLSFDIFVFY